MLLVPRGGLSADTSRMPSRYLWGLVDRMLTERPGHGVHFFDDGVNFGLSAAVATNVGRYVSNGHIYVSYEDTGNSITQSTTDRQGVVSVTTDTTDNDESWLQAQGVQFAVNKANQQFLLFESRIKVAQIATGNMFIGLANPGNAAADFVSDAGAMANTNYIGFRVLEADADGLDFVFKVSGGTEVVVKDVAQALVADTWYKVGFYYNPVAPADERIAYTINGVRGTSFITKAVLEGATFPDGAEMAPIFGGKNSSAAANTWRYDWIRGYQPMEDQS